MVDTEVFVGLDFETSGLSIGDGHVPLTLGLAWFENKKIESWTTSFHIPGEWEPEALHVNNLLPPYKPYDPQATREEAFREDRELWASLTAMFGRELYGKLIPVGWNVGAFDMKFMERFFPRSFGFFSHRVWELNTQARIVGSIRSELGEIRGIKEAVKYEIEQSWEDKQSWNDEGKLVQWHDAEFDAIASLQAKDIMTEMLKTRIGVHYG